MVKVNDGKRNLTTFFAISKSEIIISFISSSREVFGNHPNFSKAFLGC
tara:strand:- start:32 stop:175 length:144 start_codon:yes stop_codon:yes gene_type:complete